MSPQLLIVVFSLLISVSSVPQVVNVDENSIFVPFANRVTLVVSNITQFSAKLEWDITRETRDHLKAMRINCTVLRSLVEPYDISNPPRINLYNPSILGVQMTIKALQPATQYSCTLVGALSLDVGRERLAIISEPITFSTLLESKGYQASVKVTMVTTIVGVLVPLTIIILAVVLILFGYHLYNKKKKKRKRGRASEPFEIDSPPPSPPPGPEKKKADASDGKVKEKHHRHKHGSTSEKKSSKREHKRETKSSTKEVKDKKKHLKKKEKALSKGGEYPTVFSELLIHSSEEDLYGYKEKLVDLDADLRWDPTTYYPIPHKAKGLSKPIQSKPIELKDLSSSVINRPQMHSQHPVVHSQHPVVHSQHPIERDQHPIERDQHPIELDQHPIELDLSSSVLNRDRRIKSQPHTSKTTKKKHRRHHFMEPLY